MSEKYLWDSLLYEKIGSYILQLITNRKLTNVYHSHDFYEFIFVLEGECEQLINQNKILQTANEVILLRPHDTHKFIGQSSTIKLLSLSVTTNELSEFANVVDKRLLKNVLENDFGHFVLEEQQMRDIVSKIIICVTNDSEILNYKVLLFFLLVYYWEITQNSNQYIPNKLKWAFKEMRKEDNFRRGIPVLLDLTGYSYSHLARLMKNYMNMTPHMYIVELKLSIAYQQIIYTDKSFEDISAYVGFESYSHFVKIFKKKYDITPSVLRRNAVVYII